MMRHTTTTITSPSSPSTATNMGSGNRKSILTSLSADEIGKGSSTKQLNEKDVSKWSSADVQHWVKQQCKKFELKKATAEKFELNGQALVLLTKHDFLRRSPEAGEVLYYALQRLINPTRANSSLLDQSGVKKSTSESHQHPRIVEVSKDQEDSNNNYPVTSSPTNYPIVEEPDDPPAIRRSQSESQAKQNDERAPNPAFPRFFHRPTVMNMAPGMAAAYVQQHPSVPPAFVFAQHPHVHLPHRPQYVHPQFFQHYQQLMTGQGILIEIMDDHDVMMTHQQPLYLVTMNGQRVIMHEVQVRQLLAEIQQRQQMQSTHGQQRQ